MELNEVEYFRTTRRLHNSQPELDQGKCEIVDQFKASLRTVTNKVLKTFDVSIGAVYGKVADTQVIIADANDRQEISAAILDGLLMGREDQKRRITRMQIHFRTNGVLFRASAFLHSLNSAVEPEDL